MTAKTSARTIVAVMTSVAIAATLSTLGSANSAAAGPRRRLSIGFM